MQNSTILIVEDDPHMLELLAVHVESAGYTVLKAQHGLAALTVLEDSNLKLDAIISDVEMPELNGYDLCSQVRELDKFKKIPFVFVSGKTGLDEKIKGFEVGGDEYITKPVEGEEVVFKLKHIIDNKITHHDLTKQLLESRNAAMQAMSYTSNLGQVLQFMQATSDIKDYSELAEKLFTTTEALGLLVLVQFHSPDGIINYRKTGEVTPLEANVIELARNKGRIFDFQARTIFNYPDFSLLVMNMPVGDNEKYGLIKDILGNLCDAIDSRVKLLSSNVVVKQKEDVIGSVTRSLEKIDQAYRDVQQANMSAIDDMIARVEDTMFGFGLSEGQEDAVRGILLFAKKKASEIFEDGNELYADFENIHEVLAKGLK